MRYVNAVLFVLSLLSVETAFSSGHIFECSSTDKRFLVEVSTPWSGSLSYLRNINLKIDGKDVEAAREDLNDGIRGAPVFVFQGHKILLYRTNVDVTPGGVKMIEGLLFSADKEDRYDSVAVSLLKCVKTF